MLKEKDLRISESAIKNLAKNYSTLDYHVKLLELLQSVHPVQKLEKLSKYQLHQFLNQILFNYYHGEEILKYKLYKLYWNKSNVVGAFEINVNRSRLDFLVVNGTTTSFEIKSELDNLSKLKKQVADYKSVFEYNYLVIDKSHIDKVYEIMPKGFGLWSYEKGRYSVLHKATRNSAIDPESQLNLLTKKELGVAFPESNPKVKTIISENDPDSINRQFKKALKERYKSRWEFITNNSRHILPIDVQFFFHANINPQHVYLR